MSFFRNFNHYKFKLFSFVMFFFIWHITSFIFNSDVLPSPISVFLIFFEEINDGELLYHLFMTLYRVLIAFFIAMVFGVTLGIIMGSKQKFNMLFDSWNILFLNIPALVIIILCYVWFGLTEIAAIIAVSLNKIPNVIVTVREGTRAVDKKLLQVAKVFKINSFSTFFSFFLPQLYPFIMASARSGIALIWKIVLVVELLGRSNGIGFKLHEFFQFFDITSILAYTFAFVIIMLIIESLIVVPLDKRINKWRV